MAIPWLTLIKVVPWTDVIANAPKVVEGAKKLWGSAHRAGAGSGGKTVSGSTYATEPAPGREGEGVALLRAQVGRLEVGVGELHEQMRDSSELIRTLADQNAELVRHMEALQGRVRWLARGVAVLGLVVVGVLVAGLA